jgi:uncharacterized repeat protein (TIGR01451 family)
MLTSGLSKFCAVALFCSLGLAAQADLVILSDLSGYAYLDNNNDGIFDVGDTPLGGVVMTLTGEDWQGFPVILTTNTQPDGSYIFHNVPQSDDMIGYTITEGSTPAYLENTNNVGSPYGGTWTPGTDAISNILFQADLDENFNIIFPSGTNYNFGELPPASLAGYVYYDSNNDGSRSAETGIGGATVKLTGQNDQGTPVNFTTTTAGDGSYSFTGLRPSDATGYTLTETQPAGYLDGKDTIGTPGGTTGNDVFTAIHLSAGVNGIENNFGEVKPVCPGDAITECGASLDPNANPGLGSPTVAGSSSCSRVEMSFQDTVSAGNNCTVDHIVQIVHRTWTLRDGCNNTATCDQTITVKDTTPPVIACAADRTIECPATPNFTDPTPTDLCGAVSLTHSDEDLAGTCGAGGKIKYAVRRTWVAKDECGNTASCSQTISVQDTTPPVIACAADHTIECPATPNFTDPTPTDLCGAVSLTHSDEPLAGTCGAGGKIKYAVRRTWVAKDECGNTASCSQTISVQDTTSPVIACMPSKTNECGVGTLTFDAPTATDACGSATIGILTTVTNVTCGNTFVATRTWQAMDACGNTSTCSQTIATVDHTPPTITCPPNTNVACANLPSCTFSATQGGWGAPPNGNNIGMLLKNNFALVYPAGFVEVGIPGGGGFSVKFTSAAAIQAYLPAGSTPAALNQDYSNPSSTSAGVFGGQVLALQLNVDFGDRGLTPSSSGPVGNLVYNDPSSALNGQTVRQILALANIALGGGNAGVSVGDLNVLVTSLNEAFDNCTTTSWAKTYILPKPQQGGIDPSSTGTATATDNCSGAVSITYADSWQMDNAGNNIITRTWIATDTCGNSSTCNQIITASKCLTLACPAGSGQVGVPYSSALVAGGGTPPYTNYSIIAGSLPAGLTLNPTTGAITGTPTTAGSFSLTAQVKDSSGAAATATCTSGCSSTTTWDFSTPAGTLGTSHAYTVNGITITAYGYNNANSLVALYGKNLGGDENGLGISGTVDNEITTTTYVQLDLAQVIAAGALNPAVMINSVQSGEAYNIYGSSSQGNLGTLIGSGATDNAWFPMPGYPTYRFISIRASAVDVLLGEVSFARNACVITIVPAPCTATVSGSVLRDCDANGSLTGEAGLSGVTVTLKNGSATVATTSTGANGAYTFSGLAAGAYSVVVTPPANYVQTIDPDGTKDSKTSITLVNCQNAANVSFGYTGTAPSVFLKKTGPAYAIAGQTITYTFAVTNTGNTCFYGGMSVTDPMLGGQIFYQSPVSPGQGFVLTRTYVVKTSDAANLINTATATGHPPTGNAVTMNSTWTVNTVPAPMGLTATPGSAKVSLNWSTVTGAASYNVKRSTLSGGPYTTIKSGATSTSYQDNSAINGTAYYYVVSAIKSGVEGPNSSPASAAPTGGLSNPWNTKDIGSVAATGGAGYNSGTFTISGSGVDIWGTADEFRYVYQTASGDCTIVARVVNMQNTDPSAKAGVMIRETLNSNSTEACVLLTPGSGMIAQTRTTTGGSTASMTIAGKTAPYWLKGVRSGSTFSGYYSSNGTAWTLIGSQTITMGTSVYIGLGVSSHNDGVLCTATFDNVTATP